ncbi:MAG: ribonuclease H family protein [Muribaculaceae bacterium]|nr:ribonuclease H family protein [Muribaculaceae bacterium]
MSSHRRKYYVVWAGHDTGVFDNWEDCQQQINGFPGARYKSFDSKEAAVNAYRGDPSEYIGIIRKIFTHPAAPVNYDAIPAIRQDALAVDGACAKNPGPMEYRCVRVGTGEEVFHMGPLDDGTNNIGEYLALVHALAMLDKQGDHLTPVYSDSRTAQAWLKRRGHKSSLARTPRNARIFELLDRADAWVQTHDILNPVIKWDTENWGEIPADFGRK